MRVLLETFVFAQPITKFPAFGKKVRESFGGVGVGGRMTLKWIINQ
jgi:hypothetical protein